jgi:glycerol-3-phosphate dehydrogenase
MRIYSRGEQLQKANQNFDVVIVGGGSTGAAVARELTARGVSAVLLERGDFASGTSSKSTKLLHGGVRYLEKAFKNFSRAQFDLVTEALAERSSVMSLAPHLCKRLPILLPLYRWWELPYYFVGLVVYDLLSGKRSIGRSRVLFSRATRERLPKLSREGLKGSVLYYDGQFDDARLNVEVLLAAVDQGLVALSYAEVLEIKNNRDLQKNSEKLTGAVVRVRDRLSSIEWEIQAKVVINAAGPFVNELWNQANCPKVQGSSGAHIVVEGTFTPNETGMLIPKTTDNRVLFMLPWKGKTLLGTTDNPQKPEENLTVRNEDISFIIDQINSFLEVKLQPKDVLSAWVGIRPLLESSGSDTQSIVREHAIHFSGSVLTVTGGKWTTFLAIARDVLGALQSHRQVQLSSTVKYSNLPGAGGKENLSLDDLLTKYSLSKAVVIEVWNSFGARSTMVLDKFRERYEEEADEQRAFFAACAWYCALYEAAIKIDDVLSRRLRTAFLDLELANQMAPVVADTMALVHGWSIEEKANQQAEWKLIYQFSRQPIETASPLATSVS